MSKKGKIKDFIETASINILEDRAAAKTLLIGLMKYMQISDDRHKEVGLIAAKYLETLQRSNEQLVKLASLKQKGSTTDAITEQDKQDLFDLIKKEEEGD